MSHCVCASAAGFEFQSNHCCHKRVKDAFLWPLIIIRVSNGNDTPTFYTLGENTQNHPLRNKRRDFEAWLHFMYTVIFCLFSITGFCLTITITFNAQL